MHRDIDPLQYWKAKKFDFPVAAKITRDHCAIPATSSLSECAFIASSNIITTKRNRMNGDTLWEIVCLKY
jgi:hypothetical protein